MRRKFSAVLAAFVVLFVPLSPALAIDAKQLREDIVEGLALFGAPDSASPPPRAVGTLSTSHTTKPEISINNEIDESAIAATPKPKIM